MFFSPYLMLKKGAFAKIWLAAHWEKRLTKADIRVVNISDAVVQLMQPTFPLALRLSGELLLGIVRIYSHKVRLVLVEAQHAQTNQLVIKRTPGGVKTPKSVQRPGIHAVMRPDTLPAIDDAKAPMDAFTVRIFGVGTPLKRVEDFQELQEWFAVPSDQPTLSLGETQDLYRRPTTVASSDSKSSSKESSLDSKRRGEQVDPSLEVPGRLEDLVGMNVDGTRGPDERTTPTPQKGDMAVDTPTEEERKRDEDLAQAEAERAAEEAAKVAEEEVPPPPQPLPDDEVVVPKVPKVKETQIDGSIQLPREAHIGRQSEHSDCVRADCHAPKTREEMDQLRWSGLSMNDKFEMPVSMELVGELGDFWSSLFRQAPVTEAADGEESEEERRPPPIPEDIAALIPDQLPVALPAEDLLPPPVVEEEEEDARRKRLREEEEGKEERRRKRQKTTKTTGSDDGRTVSEAAAIFAGYFADAAAKAKRKGAVVPLSFQTIVDGASRREAAARFYDVLVMKKENIIDCKQKTPYGDISIVKMSGVFDEVARSGQAVA